MKPETIEDRLRKSIEDATDYAIRSTMTIRLQAEKIAELKRRIVEFHQQVCTAENCVLDGGIEHQEAFNTKGCL